MDRSDTSDTPEDSFDKPTTWDSDRVPRLWDGLNREIRRRGVQADVADDVTQEAWLRTLRRPPSDRKGLRAWLRVVGLRVLQEVLRRNQWRVEREKHAARTDSVAGDESSTDSRIFRMVRELPDPYQKVLWLRYAEELDVPEIAKLHGVTESTIRSQIKRGLDRLRERVGDEEKEELGRGRGVWAALLWRIREAARGRMPSGRAMVACAVGLGLVVLAGIYWPKSDGRASVQEVKLARAEEPLGGGSKESLRTAATSNATTPDTSDPIVEPRTAFLRQGHVRQPDGTPIAGAQVWSSRARGSAARPVARTDADGAFRIESVPLDDFLFATHTDWVPSRPINFAAGRGAAELYLRASVGRLTLRLSQGGLPLAGARVELWWNFDRQAVAVCSERGDIEVEDERSVAETDAQGEVAFAQPMPGAVRLTVTAPGRVQHVEVLTLPSGDVLQELDLSSQALIEGTVVDAAGERSPGARIEWVDGAVDTTFTVEADENGRFTLPLDPGPFELRATERSEGRAHHGQALGELLPSEHRTLVIALDDLSTLSGRALGAGAPLVNVPIDCWEEVGDEAWRARTFTDARGNFAFQGLSQDTSYTVQLIGRGEVILDQRNAIRCGSGEVQLETDETPVPDRRFVLEFSVADPSWMPTVVEARGASASHVAVVPVDPAGRCALWLPESECSTSVVLAWVPGIGPFSVELSAEPGVQRVAVPTPATVTFVALFPPETGSRVVRGRILLPNFGASWLMELRGRKTYRELALDDNVLLFPDCYRYLFEGPELAHSGGVLCLKSGESRVVMIEFEAGVPVTIQVPYRSGKAPTLAVQSAERWFEISSVPDHLGSRFAQFQLRLSSRTTAVEAFYLGQCGSVPLTPADLGLPERRIEIPLGACERGLADLRLEARGGEPDSKRPIRHRPRLIQR
jgi:RNA polymerase sigma-70 factor (ECF subfamily)